MLLKIFLILLCFLIIWSVLGFVLYKLVGRHIVEIRTKWIRYLIVGPVVWAMVLASTFRQGGPL